jgi:hypothetical protein
MSGLDDILKHHGVKGMRWGVVRNRNRPGGADGRPDKNDNQATTAIGRRLNSMKRERQWKAVLKEVDSMTTKEITAVKKRVDLENSLKTLSKSKAANKKDRDDYIRRDKMSDQELSRKVTRLRAKNGLYESVDKASIEQRLLGEKVVQVASSVGFKYAVNRGKITPKDLLDTAVSATKDPKGRYEEGRKEVLKNVTDPKARWVTDQGLKALEKKWQVKQDKK